MDSEYTMNWDKERWEKLRRKGWIEVWRNRNRTSIKYSIFKTSYKCSQLVSRIYRILLGEEDLPTSDRSIFYNNKLRALMHNLKLVSYFIRNTSGNFSIS